MPDFDEKAVTRLADMTKIALTSGEAAALAKALSAVSASWEKAASVNVDNEDIWMQKTWPTPWREDVVGHSFTPDEATSFSGRTAAGLFQVPEIL